MPDEPEDELPDHYDDTVGHAEIRVSPRAIHKAVRNILANEMNLDVGQLKLDIQAKANAQVSELIKKCIDGKGYGEAQVEDRVRRAVERVLDNLKSEIKDVARGLVKEYLAQQIDEAIEVVLSQGMELRYGWNRKVKVTITEKPKTEGK